MVQPPHRALVPKLSRLLYKRALLRDLLLHQVQMRDNPPPDPARPQGDYQEAHQVESSLRRFPLMLIPLHNQSYQRGKPFLEPPNPRLQELPKRFPQVHQDRFPRGLRMLRLWVVLKPPVLLSQRLSGLRNLYLQVPRKSPLWAPPSPRAHQLTLTRSWLL